jgi:hypothetical protein
MTYSDSQLRHLFDRGYELAASHLEGIKAALELTDAAGGNRRVMDARFASLPNECALDRAQRPWTRSGQSPCPSDERAEQRTTTGNWLQSRHAYGHVGVRGSDPSARFVLLEGAVVRWRFPRRDWGCGQVVSIGVWP